MKKYEHQIAVFLICLLIGFGIVVQARITDGQKLYVSPGVISDYGANIESEKMTAGYINEMYKEGMMKLDLYNQIYDETNRKDVNDMKESLESELDKLRILNGTERVEGPGVIVTVDDGTRALLDGESINNLLVHDSDILLVLNELRRAGAEALSVNGQRILPTTSINCSGYTVRINGTTYARPFMIKAIGNGRRMADCLLAPEGVANSLKDWGIQFQVRLTDHIIIDAYEAEPEFRYMTKKEGEDKN
ncbi:MAG: DUF881 domain-containing protein [Clostridia bacterium]|nr:DUF881 domain-containing protein [Clostridia bacterium]